ncbi:MAG TPA: hypothetical protein VG433_12505 [Pirellulales bacterium]|jgi:hypothetical protein|nr:hypothetical protein [Pirellulales bacterium]
MRNDILAGGAHRMQRTPEFQARLRKLRESIEALHAAELADAGLFRRLIVNWRIAAEFRRERKKMVPSAHAL